MGHGCGLLRALLGVILLSGIVWFMYVTVVVDHTIMTVARRRITLSTGTIEHLEFFAKQRFPIAKQRFPIHQDPEIHYVSRRRVPSGPDPIHNRRVSKDRQPPGRS